MTDHLLLIFTSASIYEFLKYFQLIKIVRFNLELYQKLIKIFKYKNASDFRKEKLILNYSRSLFIVSIKIISIVMAILVFMLILNSLSESYFDLVISPFGIIELSTIFLVYHLIRKKIYAKLQ